MPRARAGRPWFLGAGVVLVLGTGALLGAAQPWSNGDSGASQVKAGSASFDIDVIETGLGLGGGRVAGVVEWQGDLLAMSSAGAVVRSPDGRRWDNVAATGFAPRRGDDCAGDAVRGIAAGKQFLVAVGEQFVPPDPGEDYCERRLRLWRSREGTDWQVVNPAGLGESDRVDTVVTDAGRILAFGFPPVARSEGDQEQGSGVTVWRSDDGQAWEAVPTRGLSKPGEYKYQSAGSVATKGGRMLAAFGTECLDCNDDDVVALWRSEQANVWQELKFSGLDALDQANSDIIPVVAQVSQGFVAFASVGPDHDYDERTPALWFSPDGEHWEAAELDGPPPTYGAMDATAATSRGVVALDNTPRGLVVWRVEPG
jgi:hypothetical protein